MMPPDITSQSVIALLPIRHHSQRIAGKNYRSLAGKPLYRYIVDSLLKTPSVKKIAIDTDSPNIRLDCEANYGDAILLLKRPAYLCAPETSMNRIILHDIEQLGDGIYLQTHATNPLLRTNTIESAIQRFSNILEQDEGDSLFSVTSRQVRIWSAESQPLNHDPAHLMQTQDLTPFYEENSCLYIFGADTMKRHHNRIGRRPRMHVMNPLEAIDIDEERDFLLAEAILRMNDEALR